MLRNHFTRLSVVGLLIGLGTSWLSGQDFNSIKHTVSASYLGVDPYGDDPPFGVEQIVSREFDQFRGDLDIGQGGARAEASLFSDLEERSGIFYAYGYAAAGLYVQGTALGSGKSDFRTVFTLAAPGRVNLAGSVIGVSDFLGTDMSFDRPGSARVLVRVRDLNEQRNVYNKVIRMNGPLPNGIQEFTFEDDDAEISLPAGRFRLIINAIADDESDNDQVEASLAVAFFEVEGQIFED